MPRLPKIPRDSLADAGSAAAELAGSPFVAQRLREAIEAARGAEAGEIGAKELKALADYIQHIVARLPKTYGERFWFDAGLIRAMSAGWSERRLFSEAIIPCYDTEWGYARLPMPLSDVRSPTEQVQTHVIEMLFLPGRDALEDVALLQYPWVAHEFAHSLMFRHDGVLIPLITPAVTRSAQKLRLAAIADRGHARVISRGALSQFTNFWMPTADHRNLSELVSRIGRGSNWSVGTRPLVAERLRGLARRWRPQSISNIDRSPSIRCSRGGFTTSCGSAPALRVQAWFGEDIQ